MNLEMNLDDKISNINVNNYNTNLNFDSNINDINIESKNNPADKTAFSFDKLLENLQSESNNGDDNIDDAQTELDEVDKIYDVLIDLEDPDVFRKIKSKVKTEEGENNEKDKIDKIRKKNLNQIAKQQSITNNNTNKIMVKNQSSNHKMECSDDKQANPFDNLSYQNGPSLDNFLDEVEGDADELMEISEEDMKKSIMNKNKSKSNNKN